MPLNGRPPLNQGRLIARSRSANEKDEESVYNMGNVIPMSAMPKVKTYIVAPTSPTPSGPSQTPAAIPTKVRMHADSSQISSIINPVHGVRDAQARQGIKPANHARANVQAVREASHINALRKQADADQERLSGGRPPSAHRSTSVPARRPSPGPALQRRDSGNSRNFLLENKIGAAAPQRAVKAEKEDDSDKYLKKPDYGRVPSYLIGRKLELAEQAAEAARLREEKLIPAGMRLLPESERQETLAILARNREDVERALSALPIIIETPSAIRRKKELEQRLQEIENAVKVFNRPKVLVQL